MVLTSLMRSSSSSLAAWLMTRLEAWHLTPARVRRLFGGVVAVAVCFLLIELHYLGSPCREGQAGCLHLHNTPGIGKGIVPKRREQSSFHGMIPFKKQEPAPLQSSSKAPETLSRDKWIIADVTSGQCKGQLDAPPGWRVLKAAQALQGDNSTKLMTLPSDLKNVRRGLKLDPQQVWLKPDAHLAAIAQGATLILQTDCSVPVGEVVRLMEEQDRKKYGMMYNQTLLFNPYAHFGAWALAPTAALNTGLWNNSRLYFIRDFSKVFARHVLSDLSADAVLVRSTKGGVGVRFDPSSAPVYVGQRSFAPVVPGCSLYHREAFWALSDPCELASPHCPAVWKLLQQRLFRELDAFSGYYQLGRSSALTAKARQRREQHVVRDQSLMNVVTFLDAWKCKEEYQFYQCFTSLIEQLQAKRYLTPGQKNAAKRFISAVQSLGVDEPSRVKTPWRGDRKISEFRVEMGSVHTALEREGRRKEKAIQTVLMNQVTGCCSHSVSGGHITPVKEWKTPAIEDVVLIISFNKVAYFWRNIGYLETNYRPYFKHIAYCVTDVDAITRDDKKNILSHMTIVEGLTSYWYLMHGCVTLLMQMKLAGVRGYMQIGDDTLLNPWRLFNTSHDVIFLHNLGHKISAKNFFVRPHWKWWRGSQGRCPLLKVMAELEALSGVSQDTLLSWAGTNASVRASRRPNTFTEIQQADKTGRTPPVTRCDPLPGSEAWARPTPRQAQRFLYNYYKVHNMSGHFVGQTQDFFYLPQTLADDYIPMSRLFMRHQVVVELALYAIQLGIAGASDIQLVQGSSLWHADRNWPEHFFNTSHFYMHPFKFRYTDRGHIRDFYCDVFLKTLVDRLRTAQRRR